MVSLKKYQTYESFRAVEDAWLNSLPSDWKLTRLQFGSSIRNSGVDKKIVEGEGLIKLCNYVDVYYHDIIDDSIDFMEASATPEEIETFRLRKGDVIMTKDSESPDDIGIPAYVSMDFDDVICGYHLCVLKTFRNELEPKFLFYFLKSTFAQSKFEIYSNGVTRFGLSYNGIKTLPVPVPSLKEQQSIATFLDQKTKQIDNLIEQKEKLLQLLTEKRIAIITQAVTKGLDPKVKMKDSGIEWLGEVPEHWEISRVDFLASVKARLGWKGLTASEYVEEGYIFLSTPNIKGEGEIDFEDVNYITEKRYFESPEIMLEEGDILIAKDGSTLGITNIIRKLPAPATVNSSIAIIRIRKDKPIYNEYLFRWLTSDYIQKLIQMMKGGQGVPHLFQADIRKFPVLCPPIEEQLAIAEYLTSFAKKTDKTISLTEQSITKLREYRASIITSAVTGRIDVRKEIVA